MEYEMVFLRQSNWLIITRQNAYMYINKQIILNNKNGLLFIIFW